MNYFYFIAYKKFWFIIFETLRKIILFSWLKFIILSWWQVLIYAERTSTYHYSCLSCQVQLMLFEVYLHVKTILMLYFQNWIVYDTIDSPLEGPNSKLFYIYCTKEKHPSRRLPLTLSVWLLRIVSDSGMFSPI